ncbi:MAG: DUF2284 domain-containing protein [Planctomycetota bacterium]
MPAKSGSHPAAPRKRLALATLVKQARELGAVKARLIRASSVVTAAWVRMKCRYGCGGYDTSLCCPPHTPTPEETRRVIDCYKHAIFFEAGRREPKKICVKLECAAFLAGYYKAFGYGSGPCRWCGDEPCNMQKGCRHADEARPAMEACGIDVFATARANGFTIEVVRDHDDVHRYFGMVMVE